VLTWLFNVEPLTIHLILAGILSLFIALLVFLIVAMDHRFRGELSVSSEAFQLVQRSLMEEDR
jgi:hypothetical protein